MMKKVVLALVAIVTVLFVGVQMSGKLSVAAESAENPENVLGVIEYEESGSKFREVDNLQEYRERLEQQGLSDYEIALNMLEVMGYTDEQIAAMTEEVILQNLPVKHSKVEIGKVQEEQLILARYPINNAIALEGLTISVSYRTIELSQFEDGRDPEDYLLFTAYFSWANHNNGIPEERFTDYITIYNDNSISTASVGFQQTNAQYPQIFAYEKFYASYRAGSTYTQVDYTIETLHSSSIQRSVSFDLPKGAATNLGGYFQTIAAIDKTVTDTQYLKVAYGHTFQGFEPSFSFGFPPSIGASFAPASKIATEAVDVVYRYVANPSTSKVYILQNFGNSRAMELFSNVNTSVITRSDEVFNKNNATHRKNSKWQFRLHSFIFHDGSTCYSLKSVAYNTYVGDIVSGGAVGIYGLGIAYRLVGNQVESDVPSYKIIPYDDGEVAIASFLNRKALVPNSLLSDHNSSTWLFHEVAEEDVGQALDSEGEYNLISNGIYKIKNVGTGKYLEVPDYSVNKETLLTLATKASKTNQEFRIETYITEVEIRPNHIDFYRLDVKGGSPSSGTYIQQYERNGTISQIFYFQPAKIVNNKMQFYIFTAVSEMQCVLEASGTSVLQKSFSGSNNQLWEVEYLCYSEIDLEQPYDRFVFRNVNSGHFLDVCDNGTSNGTQILQYYYNGNTNQQWKINYEGSGMVSVRPYLNTNTCLDIHRGLNTNGTKTQLWTYEGYDNQTFKIVQKFRNQYVIYSNCSGFTKCLRVQDASTSSNKLIQHWDYTGNSCLWVIEEVETSGTMTRRNTNKRLSISAGTTTIFYFRPKETAAYTIETFGYRDTLLSIYKPDGTLYAGSNNNAGFSNNEKRTLGFVAGQTYEIRVSYNGADLSGPTGISVY